MRMAIIDLGTNSVRFDVHALQPSGRAKLLYREKLMLRLGQGVFTAGKIREEAVIRTLQAFGHFRELADFYKVRKTIAFGTSALRDASNADFLISEIKSKTGFEVKRISGKEEAALIASGVLSNESIGKGKKILVDIGGGSTEIIACQNGKILYCDSFDLGTARLQQIFLRKSPPKPEAIDELRTHIQQILQSQMELKRHRTGAEIIGSSGTVKSISKILKNGGGPKSFKTKELSKWVEEISSKDTTQLLEVDGMESKRVDMILAGSILLEEIALFFKTKSIRSTEFSLRDGILQDEIKLVQRHKTSRLEVHVHDFIREAERYGVSKLRSERSIKLIRKLFHELQRDHKLSSSFEIYLVIAIILKDTGKFINIHDFESHSCYLVENMMAPSMQDWESELIANLVLYQNKKKIEANKNPYAGNKKIMPIFVKLHALLQLGSFFTQNSGRLEGRLVVKRSRQGVRLSIAPRSLLSVGLLKPDLLSRNFQEIFHRNLQLN